MTTMTTIWGRLRLKRVYGNVSNSWPAGLVATKQVHPPATPSMRRWVVGSDDLTLVEAIELQDLYDETKGAGLFLWTPTTEVTEIDCRFVFGSFRRVAITKFKHSAEVEIEAFRPTA